MDLFEYQGKQYFARFGIPTSQGGVVTSVDAAINLANQIGYPVVLKAQVKVGGRGKAGGVKIAADADEARAEADSILGMDIKGHLVEVLWIERASSIAEEYYASFTLDRTAKLHLCMVSARGGVEIEQVAEEDPDAISRLYVDPVEGLSAEAALDVVTKAGLNPTARHEAADILMKLYRCYVEGDADLVEINPLILTGDGHVHALDAKVTLDDSAAFRHPEWESLDGGQDTDFREEMAKARGLNYVGLSGSTGIIANGAGLAMSTVDLVSQVGGSAANFLDVGGAADADVMVAALEVINSDDRVRSILVNIFGGIVRCDEVARGILEAMHRVELRCPITIRLDGTNAVEARQILADHLSEKLIAEPTMLGAARRAVEMASA
ncbi:MAG: ADP-forming succinate--CoA ligase subunit beta [Acidimicrobiales bacterium]